MNIFASKVDREIITKDEKYPDMIIDNLYMGNLINASDKESLKVLGITHILIFASYMDPQFPEDFLYKQVEVHDLPNFDIRNHLKECYE
jgi:hypothetical protein